MSRIVPFVLLALVAASAGFPFNDGSRTHIVGGETTDIKQVPYQVSIELKKAHHCGGSVLSTTWILTAAHCVYGSPISALQVRAGTDKLQHGGSVHQLRQAVVHPSYKSGRTDWDVAVVELSSALPLSASVKAVPLPASGKEPQTNVPVVASGWGLTTPQAGSGGNRHFHAAVGAVGASPNMPTQLRKVTVRVVSRTSCTAAYKTALSVRMICAAAPGKDTCTYDSGGPLVDPQGVQVGVVSWGNGCADPKYPGVYVHLGNPDVRSFIKSHTKL